MKDNPDKETPDPSRGKRVLGRLPKGEPEREPEPPPEGTFGAQPGSQPDIEASGLQRRKGSKPPPRVSHRRPSRPEASEDDKLALPEDALVTMRRSGGFRFTSKSVVIYRDGRVVTEGTGYGAARQLPAKWLSDEGFAELYRALGTARLHDFSSTGDQGPGVRGQGPGTRDLGFGVGTDSFAELPSTSGRANPDAYVYEVTARIGPNTYTVEVFDGSVPEQLAPLIEFLSRHMRPARQAKDWESAPDL